MSGEVGRGSRERSMRAGRGCAGRRVMLEGSDEVGLWGGELAPHLTQLRDPRPARGRPRHPLEQRTSHGRGTGGSRAGEGLVLQPADLSS